MKTIRIGGVPEHFNLPIHLAIENEWFSKEDIQLTWKDFPGGSGYMKEALRKDEVDICILLTEGIVTDILKGNPSKIVSGYVKTSLTWGIHTHTRIPMPESESIFDKKIAISRFGSGSHLMPIVNAMMKDQRIEEEQFVQVKDVNGGIDALENGDAEIFYWEKFTTKPYVEKGLLKKVDEFISPWPCFMIAATNKIIESDPATLSRVLKIIHNANQNFMNLENAVQLVSDRYGLTTKDAERWYHATEWSTNGWVSNKMLEGVLYSLREAKIVEDAKTTRGIIWERNAKN
ncbi:ABC-type nitrate/sulfonate/bicarbonate transport system, substrate-binding protein [Ekhidna lutea]|uniref:ABC-type nitrate/sulfonate/bicarbonate transport system, substrate-binding protein n=1 Tax=Ekhidna lutea TaxID=447679 RepID=A0A239HR38_EKHLU|nr:ABC transporter substrate-binding protein [Ekhidna lutea]SNS83782.1 ABC-type nitrate/sulfonate/bicarbonate transport system, substrate-binding protein [Ekhidna lutea]